jgi:hypothetical protein
MVLLVGVTLDPPLFYLTISFKYRTQLKYIQKQNRVKIYGLLFIMAQWHVLFNFVCNVHLSGLKILM